jgi:hypothetical protein
MPQVQEYLKSRGMPEKAVLLVDSAPLHPNKNVLRSNYNMWYGHFTSILIVVKRTEPWRNFPNEM